MPYKGKLYRPAAETSIHLAFKNALKEYFVLHEKLMVNQSASKAKQLRKILIRIQSLAQKRKSELLDLYSNFRNDKIVKKCYSNYNELNN